MVVIRKEILTSEREDIVEKKIDWNFFVLIDY